MAYRTAPPNLSRRGLLKRNTRACHAYMSPHGSTKPFRCPWRDRDFYRLVRVTIFAGSLLFTKRMRKVDQEFETWLVLKARKLASLGSVLDESAGLMSRTESLLLAQLGKLVVSSSPFYYVCLLQQLKSTVRVRFTALPTTERSWRRNLAAKMKQVAHVDRVLPHPEFLP